MLRYFVRVSEAMSLRSLEMRSFMDSYSRDDPITIFSIIECVFYIFNILY